MFLFYFIPLSMNREELIYDWQARISRHKRLLEKGKFHIKMWKEYLEQNLNKSLVEINKTDSSYEFSFIGLRFKTQLKVKSAEFNKGLLITYLIEKSENGNDRLVECIKYTFDSIGNIDFSMNNWHLHHYTDLLKFLNEYLNEEHSVDLKLMEPNQPI
jgi:hypothetical protein